jgi:hypothetical protein
MSHKVIRIPLFRTPLHFYVGDKGLEYFKRDLKKMGVDVDSQVDASSADLHYTNHIYISDIMDTRNIVHESIHYLDWICEEMGFKEEPEFRAYLGAWVVERLLKEQKKETI